MALEQRTRGQEILIRLKNDDTGVNVIGGAQYQTITEILNDGDVISAKMNAPIPLNLVGDGGNTLAGLLGEVTSNALLQNEALQISLVNVNAIAAEQMASLTQAHEHIAQLTANNERLIHDYQSQVAALSSQVSDLQSQMFDLQAQLAAATAPPAAPDDSAESAA